MEAKILRPMAYSKRLAKPLLIITVTDGEPSETPKDKIVDVIKECSKKVPNAVAFQFAQVRGMTNSTLLSRLVTLSNHALTCLHACNGSIQKLMVRKLISA
jgi:hypothetical protein